MCSHDHMLLNLQKDHSFHWDFPSIFFSLEGMEQPGVLWAFMSLVKRKLGKNTFSGYRFMVHIISVYNLLIDCWCRLEMVSKNNPPSPYSITLCVLTGRHSACSHIVLWVCSTPHTIKVCGSWRKIKVSNIWSSNLISIKGLKTLYVDFYNYSRE